MGSEFCELRSVLLTGWHLSSLFVPFIYQQINISVAEMQITVAVAVAVCQDVRLFLHTRTLNLAGTRTSPLLPLIFSHTAHQPVRFCYEKRKVEDIDRFLHLQQQKNVFYVVGCV